MAEGLQSFPHLVRHRSFQNDSGPSHVPDPGGINGILQVHVKDQEVQEELGMPLGLHGSSHDPEGHEGLPVLRDKPGDQGVEGPFSWGNLIWMTILQGKAGSPVLKNETSSRGYHA
jgi:hypothetical protein